VSQKENCNVSGKYVVAVNANDICCLGCRPRFFTSTILLPEGATRQDLMVIWTDICANLTALGISSVGGHTEVATCLVIAHLQLALFFSRPQVTPAVRWPVVAGSMLGEPLSGHFLNPHNARAGDVILMWQTAGMEGTALLAEERRSFLSESLSESELAGAVRFLTEPGICIWPFVKRLLPREGVVAIHDPTEVYNLVLNSSIRVESPQLCMKSQVR
jgi:hydrogenase expression/formation protein HypE